MPNPRLAAQAVAHAPRNALWCQAQIRALVDDPTVVALASADGLAVRVIDRLLDGGRLLVTVGGWRWPDDQPDLVGELVVSTAAAGLAVVGWWTQVYESRVAPRSLTLEMDVAGLSLWSGRRRISTEEPNRIRALLAC